MVNVKCLVCLTYSLSPKLNKLLPKLVTPTPRLTIGHSFTGQPPFVSKRCTEELYQGVPDQNQSYNL